MIRRHLLNAGRRGATAICVAAAIGLGGGSLHSQEPVDKGIEELQAAAAKGDAEAQTLLADIYRYGEGVPEDDAEAIKWYRLAAEQGHPEAQTMLAQAYFWGEGVAQDFRESARWFRQAAEQGDPFAQFRMGLAYFWGRGVVQDYVQAHMWLNLSSAQGREEAAEWRNVVAEELTPALIAEAQRLAREWKPKEE